MAYPANIGDLSTYMDDIGGTNTTVFATTARYRSFDRGIQALNQEIQDAMEDYNFNGEKSTHDLNFSGGVPQREYLFPIDMMKIKRIDVSFDGIKWYKCDEVDPNELGNNYANETDITNKFSNTQPKVYYTENGFVILSGTWSATVTGGIILTYSKQVVGQDVSGNDLQNFATTTDIPNLPEFAKMWLVYWGLLDFYINETNESMIQKWNKLLYGNPNGRPADQKLIGGLLRKILNYYSSKSPDQQIQVGSAYQQSDFN